MVKKLCFTGWYMVPIYYSKGKFIIRIMYNFIVRTS